MRDRLGYDLICFDVDGTLVVHPSGKIIWEILNRKFTGSDQINRERYRMYREGEITYADWVRLDVEGWVRAGADRDDIVEAVHEFALYEGALETVNSLKKMGVHLAVISGTIDIVINTLFPGNLFDDIYSNKLFFDDDGRITSWEATPFDLQGKPLALRELVRKHGVTLERTAFVGDGDNDVPIIGVAGCVVAFNPRSQELESRADYVIKGKNMMELLDTLAS